MSCVRWRIAVVLAVCALAVPVHAECRRIDGLRDVNCDLMVKILATGDSIVRGRGDDNMTSSSGGWVLDLSQTFTDVKFVNLGIPGVSTTGLYTGYRRAAPRMGKTYALMKYSDYILIEVGTNDYWEKLSTARSIRNLDRLKKYLEGFHKAYFGYKPVVVVSTLPPTSRQYQALSISRINQRLLLPYYRKRLNVLVRFDLLPQDGSLSWDGLHPNTIGYEVMAEIAAKALTGPMQKQAARLAVTPTPTPTVIPTATETPTIPATPTSTITPTVAATASV